MFGFGESFVKVPGPTLCERSRQLYLIFFGHGGLNEDQVIEVQKSQGPRPEGGGGSPDQ